MVKIETGFCRTDELGTVLSQFNQEFIYSKGRTIEVQHRFPGILNKPENILVRRVGGVIVSALALKRVTWETPTEQYRATMIGLVWTIPSMRARGHAAANLDFLRSQLSREQCDFAVLWTTQPAVYSGSGWVATDCGRYGVLSGQPGIYSETAINRASIEKIQGIRKVFAPMRVSRDSAAAFPLPPPANELKLLLEPNAYAILGLAKDETYVLDIIGDPQALQVLWQQISRTGMRIHLNAPDRSPINDWVNKILQMDLPFKPLAMWQPLSKRAMNLNYESIYIPMLDRL